MKEDYKNTNRKNNATETEKKKHNLLIPHTTQNSNELGKRWFTGTCGSIWTYIYIYMKLHLKTEICLWRACMWVLESQKYFSLKLRCSLFSWIYVNGGHEAKRVYIIKVFRWHCSCPRWHAVKSNVNGPEFENCVSIVIAERFTVLNVADRMDLDLSLEPTTSPPLTSRMDSNDT